MSERYSLVAATAAQRVGLAPRYAHLDRTSVHVDGRYNSDEEPDEHGMHLTRGYRRAQRPDLTHVRLDVMVAHQAGIPVLMKPRSGNSRAGPDFDQLITDQMAQVQSTDGMTCLVADSALYRAENLHKLAEPRTTWMTRVPATLSAAPAVWAQGDPQTMAPLPEGYRDHVRRSSDGGGAQRWVLLHSAARQPQAQRPIDKPLLKLSEQAVHAFTHLCRTALACTADAPQALATFAQGLQATFMPQSTVGPTPRDAKRGRPGQGLPPAQGGYPLEGALALRIAPRQALIDPHRGFILATHALDDTLRPPQELFAGYTGPAQAERGVRFLKDPQFLASARSLKQPERRMALLRVMTVCLLVSAALEYRIRQALKEPAATVPDQKGKRVQNPTARGVFHSWVGIHLLYLPQQWPIVITLTAEHQHLLQLLGKRYAWFSW